MGFVWSVLFVLSFLAGTRGMTTGRPAAPPQLLMIPPPGIFWNEGDVEKKIECIMDPPNAMYGLQLVKILPLPRKILSVVHNIGTVKLSDAGTYECQLIDKTTNSLADAMTRHVNVAPKTTSPFSSTTSPGTALPVTPEQTTRQYTSTTTSYSPSTTGDPTSAPWTDTTVQDSNNTITQTLTTIPKTTSPFSSTTLPGTALPVTPEQTTRQYTSTTTSYSPSTNGEPTSAPWTDTTVQDSNNTVTQTLTTSGPAALPQLSMSPGPEQPWNGKTIECRMDPPNSKYAVRLVKISPPPRKTLRVAAHTIVYNLGPVKLSDAGVYECQLIDKTTSRVVDAKRRHIVVVPKTTSQFPSTTLPGTALPVTPEQTTRQYTSTTTSYSPSTTGEPTSAPWTDTTVQDSTNTVTQTLTTTGETTAFSETVVTTEPTTSPEPCPTEATTTSQEVTCSTDCTPTSNQTKSTTGRPTFEKLMSAYPTKKTHADYKSLETEMKVDNWTFCYSNNTCAVRMSKTFIDAGLTLNHTKAAKCPSSKYAGVKGHTGKYAGEEVFIRAKFFKCYLKGIWGAPDICNIKKASDIQGKKGVLIFTGCSFGQHIDLWDGSKCALSCPNSYFKDCKCVQLYILP